MKVDNHEDLFRGASPLCRRIIDDMDQVRSNYGPEWTSIPYADQCRILDQAIVDEVSIYTQTISFIFQPRIM